MKEWSIIQFGDLYLEPSRNGLMRPQRVRGSGFKMVNMGEIFAYDRINDPPMELVPLNDKERENYTLQKGDLLFARQSMVESGAGKCVIVLNVPEVTTFESHLIRVRLDDEKCLPNFYYYYFQSPVGRGKIQSIVTGAAQKGIRGSDLQRLDVDLPDLGIQERIAEILGAYDDLIDNNNRRVALLEEAIHRLYREWFVHLRFPGHEHTPVVAGVPEGWEKRPLGDIAQEMTRRVHPSELNEPVPYVGLGHIPRQSIALVEWESSDDVTSSKFRFEKGEILFGKIRPYFHKVVFAPISGICSSDTIVIRPYDPTHQGLILAVASGESFVQFASKTSKEGSKMPRANWKVMAQYPVFVPSNSLLADFEGFVSNSTHQIETLLQMNRKLKEARDALLPRLMNGSLPV